jgi:hypothetical protein
MVSFGNPSRLFSEPTGVITSTLNRVYLRYYPKGLYQEFARAALKEFEVQDRFLGLQAVLEEKADTYELRSDSTGSSWWI